MKEAIKNLAERIEKTISVIQTEEATKNAYIMPFLQLLGYDVFNPLEVVPEFTADVGSKNEEKVDYAIVLNGKPAILIECKMCANELNVNNESQLLRYFHTTAAKFAILTNGVTYKFYTDLVEPNKMDLNAFMTINLRDYDKINYSELAKFHKEKFDADNIRKTADMLKCSNSIKRILNDEFTSPSEEFVRMIFKKMDTTASIFTEKQKEKLTPLVKSALENMISEKVKANLDAALKTTTEAQIASDAVHETVLGADTGVVTTQDEIDAYNIIKAIAVELVAPDKVVMRDAKSYCAILFDDNNRKPICRLFFNNPEKKSIVVFDGPQEERIAINNLHDIFELKERILAAIKKYQADLSVPVSENNQVSQS